MLSSRLFWKIFGTYIALTLIAAVTFVTIQSGRQQEMVLEQVQQRLHDSAILLRSQMAEVFVTGPNEATQNTLQELGKQSVVRMTLVALDGTVLADSDEDPARMNNHLDREELRQARTQGFGVSRRDSPTLTVPMFYYALRVDRGNRPVGFVRVAMTMELVNARIGSVRRLVWVTAFAMSLAALVITYFVVGRIVRPILTLTDSAELIASGNLQQRVDLASRDELGTLAEAFNFMGEQLANRIEELQQQSQELSRNSQRLETVLGGMIEGVIAVDRNERVLFSNRAANVLLEIASPGIVGRPIWEAVRNSAIQQVVQDALKMKEQKYVELEIPRMQATVSLLAAQLPGDPCPGVVLVFHDVTELRRLENLRREFVSNVSHELKTPLTSIQAYAETLLSGAIDDPEHNLRFVKGIEEQADRLHALILDLLQLSRIESGANVFEVSAIPLEEAVDLCIQQHSAVCDTKQITLTAEPLEPSVRVLADVEGLQTILDNLIDNAINHTPQGGKVTVRWRTENSIAVLEVIDTGIGIHKEHFKRIFERFYRVDKARSRELGGTGLGLSIVKHLSQEFGGRVDVASQPGQGSTFTVRLPLALE
ncbi:MAG TPA: ATP-binding protein [Planctomycetaceae bacterium]|nr:ATP-binding protein [Planctomycetaceae bacterium]